VLMYQYNEHNPAFPPPPIALPPQSLGSAGQTLGMDEMAAILDSGFDDNSAHQSSTTLSTQYRSQPPPPFSLSHSNSYMNGNGNGNGMNGGGYTSSPLHRTAYTPPTPTENGWGESNPLDSGMYSHGYGEKNYGPGTGYGNGYGNGFGNGDVPGSAIPLPPHSGDSISSSVESRANHAKKRSGGAGADRYGPLGPLADDDTGWGGGLGFGGKKSGGGGGGGRMV
jgi:chitin synthase